MVMALSSKIRLLALLGLSVAVPQAARADIGSFEALVVGLGISAGAQFDERGCAVGGESRNFPYTSTCLLFAGGIDVSMLWRGRVGGSIGVSGVAGQAAIPMSQPANDVVPPSYPDRVSVPVLLDVRPLAFLISPGDTGYKARLMHGVRVGIGPSYELVRTSSDSHHGWGLNFSFDGEIPLHAALTSGLSLRMTTRVLYTEQVALNEGIVRSAPFECAECGPTPQGAVGTGARVQLLFGLCYYL